MQRGRPAGIHINLSIRVFSVTLRMKRLSIRAENTAMRTAKLANFAIKLSCL